MVGRHAHDGGRRGCKLCRICVCAGDPGDAARRAEHHSQVRCLFDDLDAGPGLEETLGW